MSWLGRSDAQGGRPSGPDDDPLAGVDIPRLDFKIVGSMKCGTTALSRALDAHPDVYLPPGEQRFFGNHRRYLSVWDLGVLDRARFEELYAAPFRSSARVVGGKAPNYVASMVALERLQRFHPGVKVVLMVRCPIARAQSHWNHLLRQRDRGKRPASLVGRTFLAHIERDLKHLEFTRDPGVEVPGTNLLWRGMYAPQLLLLRRLFTADRVFVGTLEDLKAEPEPFLRGLCAFLGVDYDPALATAAAAVESRAPVHTERLRRGDRERLRDIYADSVVSLERLLGRMLPGWLRV